MFDVCITSIGGVGSSIFIKEISKYVKTNKNSFAPGTDPYKHSMYPPKDKFIKKAIFIIGNIYNSTLSIITHHPYIHLINKGLLSKKYINNNITDYLQKYINGNKDTFRLYEQISNWTNANVHYDIMIIKSDMMFSNMKDICNFLEIPVIPNLIKKSRNSNINTHPNKNELYKILTKAKYII